MGILQHFLQDDVLAPYGATAIRAREREVDIARAHPRERRAAGDAALVGEAVRRLLDMGYRDVRNQGVLLRGVNTTPSSCWSYASRSWTTAKILPYYFYVRHDPERRALAARGP